MMADIDMERLQQFGDAQITVGKWNALQAENAALRARIAELEAPVLPDAVQQVVEQLRKYVVRRRDGTAREPPKFIREAAALLTRLSTVTEEDVERAAEAIDEVSNRLAICTSRDGARAALTARLKGDDSAPIDNPPRSSDL